MAFIRTIEDFTCEHCGARVLGDGYTNHCPRCLWSKHVDISPGDRKAGCHGMMRPVKIEGSTPFYRIVHRCERCTLERRVDIDEADDIEAILALASDSSSGRGKR